MDIGIRDVQLFSLEVLKDVVRVLDKFDINYQVTYGTLLGAIRHKGFIPWDDDIDIAIPMKEYKTAIKILKRELNADKYFIQNYQTEKEYNTNWTQVRVNNTTSMPTMCRNHNIHYGFCIDIFPIIGLYNNSTLQKMQKKLIPLGCSFLAKEWMTAISQEAVGKQRIINGLPRGIRKVLVDFINVFVMRDIKKSNYSIIMEGANVDVKYKSSIFVDREKYKFEDIEVYGPKDYNAFLSTIYGDYMTPPPNNERNGHNGAFGDIIFDFNKDYSFYKDGN